MENHIHWLQYLYCNNPFQKTLLTMTIFRASTDQWPILNQHIFTLWKFWEEVSGKFKICKKSSIVTFERDLFYVFGVKIIAFTTSLLFMFIVTWTLLSCEALCVFQLYPGLFCCILPSYLFFTFSERQLIHWI